MGSIPRKSQYARYKNSAIVRTPIALNAFATSRSLGIHTSA